MCSGASPHRGDLKRVRVPQPSLCLRGTGAPELSAASPGSRTPPASPRIPFKSQPQPQGSRAAPGSAPRFKAPCRPRGFVQELPALSVALAAAPASRRPSRPRPRARTCVTSGCSSAAEPLPTQRTAKRRQRQQRSTMRLSALCLFRVSDSTGQIWARRGRVSGGNGTRDATTPRTEKKAQIDPKTGRQMPLGCWLRGV